jgi:hypothetical protein
LSCSGSLAHTRCLDRKAHRSLASWPNAFAQGAPDEGPTQVTAPTRHRFHSICPYFAMFPEQFASTWIDRLSKPGDLVLDPFAGRGTAPFQALLQGRAAIGADINPVAYVLTAAKLRPPTRRSLIARVRELECGFVAHAGDFDEEARALPPFFRRAFHHSTLRQLLFLRRELRWRSSSVDRFLAALSLGSLHGEMDKSRSYFSNQMPRTISTKPRYSLGFWARRRLWPRRRNVFLILRERIGFRYQTPPPAGRGLAFLSDVRDLPAEARAARGRVDLVVTSPPYLDVTNFGEDQWLRLWFLGGTPYPAVGRVSRDDRHEHLRDYWTFICAAWEGVRPLLSRRAAIVCRIGGRRQSADDLRAAVTGSMRFLARAWTLVSVEESVIRRRQTDAFRPGAPGCGFEVDLVFRLRQ